MAEYTDHSLFGTQYDVLGRFQKNRDAGQRFFGFGPDSRKDREANYIQDYWLYNLAAGAPLTADSPFRARLSQRDVASRVLNGPIPGRPTFASTFPQQYAQLAQQTDETRLTLDFDTRDHAVTTSRGVYSQVYVEKAARGGLS